MAKLSVPELRSSCPVAASLDVLGDRWTLVILRDLLIGGRSHFADFAADESIATNTLAERLQRLRDAGIIARCSRSARVLVAIDSSAAKSAKWDLPPIRRSRKITNVHRSPRTSSDAATGHEERSSGTDNFAIPPSYLQSKSDPGRTGRGSIPARSRRAGDVTRAPLPRLPRQVGRYTSGGSPTGFCSDTGRLTSGRRLQILALSAVRPRSRPSMASSEIRTNGTYQISASHIAPMS